MLATSKNVLLPGHNHLLVLMTRHFDYCLRASEYQYQWLADGYDLEIGIFRSG